MDKANFTETIKFLSGFSNKLEGFKNNDEELLTVIKGLERGYLESEHSKFQKNIIGHPVNHVKFIVIDKILIGKNISLYDIDEIKHKIQEKDTALFNDYPEFREAILNFKEGTKYFHVWNNIFKNCFFSTSFD